MDHLEEGGRLLLFALGLAVAVLLTPLRRHLARWALWEGAALALVLFAPYVLWLLGHDWATVEFTRNAARYAALPAEERGRAAIVTRNYGEAGAIDYYGRRYGLPPAVSQHNNYFLWGPGSGSVFIMIGWPTRDLTVAFTHVEVAGRMESPYAMPFETRWPIHVCRGLKLPLDEAWRRGKFFI